MPYALCVISFGERSSLKRSEKGTLPDGNELKTAIEGQLPACHFLGKIGLDIILQIIQ